MANGSLHAGLELVAILVRIDSLFLSSQINFLLVVLDALFLAPAIHTKCYPIRSEFSISFIPSSHDMLDAHHAATIEPEIVNAEFTVEDEHEMDEVFTYRE